jgi:outer membrane protein TolC
VAFAATRKFDGFQYRQLNPGELAQVAGRAGRYMNDGTFGCTGEADAFDQETINRLENHNFDSIRSLQWRNPDLDFETEDTIPVLQSLNVDTTEQFLKQHNPLLIEANRNVDLQTAILQQNRSFYFPQLSFTGGYGFNTSSSSASFFLLNQNLGWNAGLTLSYNLFDGFKTRNLVDISKINVQNAHLQFRQVLSGTQALLSNAFHKYKAALQQMLVLQQNLQLARENFQIALQMYKLYAITQIELQQAHQSFEDAAATYVAAVYAVKSAETNLFLLNGSLVQ